MRFLPVLAIVIGVLMLAGCGKKPTTVPDGAGSTATGETETGTAGDAEAGEGGQRHLFRLRPQ
jgi:predicted small lipoprotein YifL